MAVSRWAVSSVRRPENALIEGRSSRTMIKAGLRQEPFERAEDVLAMVCLRPSVRSRFERLPQGVLSPGDLACSACVQQELQDPRELNQMALDG